MVGIVDDGLINVFVIKVKKQVGFAVLSAVRAIITLHFKTGVPFQVLP